MKSRAAQYGTGQGVTLLLFGVFNEISTAEDLSSEFKIAGKLVVISLALLGAYVAQRRKPPEAPLPLQPKNPV
jgi:hypothetical protein